MKKGYIYKITSPSEKIYIGKTTNIEIRFKDYKKFNCNSQKILCSSLKKYGFDKHNIEIIKEGVYSDTELNQLEVYYIDLYNSFNRDNINGMNLTFGGEGCTGRVMSEETKRKIGEKSKLRRHSDEVKRKISENRKKVGFTEAQKLAAEKSRGRKIIKSEEWIKNNAESIKKPILQFDLDGNFIREWKSAKDVELELGLSRKNISANLRNKTKHAYGYKWIFKQN
jgi:group I intron endonuclease